MKQKRNYTLTEQEENKIVNQIYNKKILLIKKLLETCHLTAVSYTHLVGMDQLYVLSENQLFDLPGDAYVKWVRGVDNVALDSSLRERVNHLSACE